MTESTGSLGPTIRLAIALGIAALLLLGVLWFAPAYRHMRYYGAAETVADDLGQLCRSLSNVSEGEVREQLATPEYSHLSSLETTIELQSSEMIWFEVNEMFNVGLAKNGAILWMVDGNRTGG